jgi:hypothetical protein
VDTFSEDAAVFFQPGDPGVVAATVNGVTVYGSLERDLEETLESPTVRSAPMLLCARAALPVITAGDTLAVGTATYVVRSIATSNFDPIAILRLNNSD